MHLHSSASTCAAAQDWLKRAAGPLPWTWASVRGRSEPPVLVLPAADPAAFLERHSAAHGPHLANVAAIAREVRTCSGA